MGLRGTREQDSGENYIMRNLVTCTAHQIVRVRKKNEIGRACSTYGREVHTGFGGET